MRRTSPLTRDDAWHCDACGAEWTPVGGQWLVKDQHGRLSYRNLSVSDDGIVPLTACPACGVKQVAVGKVRVEEVKD